MLESKKTLAKEIMKTDVVTVSPSATVQEVARQMLEHDISGFPVVDEQKKVLGVVTELDLMRNQIAPNEPSIWATIWGMDAERTQKYRDAQRKYLAKTAGEVMTAPALTVDVSDNVERVANLMFNKQIKRIFVTEEGKLAGVISRSAFTRMMLEMNM